MQPLSTTEPFTHRGRLFRWFRPSYQLIRQLPWYRSTSLWRWFSRCTHMFQWHIRILAMCLLRYSRISISPMCRIRVGITIRHMYHHNRWKLYNQFQWFTLNQFTYQLLACKPKQWLATSMATLNGNSSKQHKTLSINEEDACRNLETQSTTSRT